MLTMTKLFDVGQQAEGIIAVGQLATGVVAIGQVATGVIAIGQVARGVIAIGMGAIGLVSIGMGSAGLFYSVGLLGVGGRGLGIILPLVPLFGRRYDFPDPTRFEELETGRRDEGWLEVELRPAHDHTVEFYVDDRARELRLDAGLRQSAYQLVSKHCRPVLAHVIHVGGRLVCDRIMAKPIPRHSSPRFWVKAAAQVVALFGLSAAVWLVAGRPLLVALFGTDGLLR